MRVIYLYTSHGAAVKNSISDNWKPPVKCGQQYDKVHGDGTFKLLEKLHKNKVITDLRIFYESNRAPGKANWVPGVYCCVIPEIRFIKPFIKEDTIFFVRGGFKTWHDLLVPYKNKNWLMLYAANTGRERWTWWDIIFEDRNKLNIIDRYNRYWNFYIKPTDETIFHPLKREIKYDLCIGASHIHDKKGQWRVIEALIRYKALFGKNLRCALPGAARRGVKSNSILSKIKKYGLDVDVLGEVSKEKLCELFNESGYFVHLGTHGQNDRGPIEALACGTPLIIGSPRYHSPVINKVAIVPDDINDFDNIAKGLNKIVKYYQGHLRKQLYDYYIQEYSFQKSYNRMKCILETIVDTQPCLLVKRKLKEKFELM